MGQGGNVAEEQTQRRQLMRTIIIMMGLCVSILTGGTMDWTAENRRIEAEQVAIWEAKLANSQLNNPKYRIQELWLGLKNMGFRKETEGHSSAVDQIYLDIQLTLLAIPGHAQHFADAIEKERKEVEDVRFNLGPRIDYDRNRMWYFETLAHLPSPEMVKVLGEYLSDERDRHEMTPEETKGQSCISGGSTGNSSYSAKALENCPLRNKPYRKGTLHDIDEAKSSWRAWWEQIKSGGKTFSFAGQEVEYRFKPDGTWETIALTNPSSDAPKSTKRFNSLPSRTGDSWPWIVGTTLMGLALVAWLGFRKPRGA